MALDRTDTSLFGRWWWTIDRLNLTAIFLLIISGTILVVAGSPPVAKRLDLPAFYFVHRHQLFLLAGAAIMLVMSFCSPVAVRRLAFAGYAISIVLMLVVPFIGVETKGAHRWIALGGFSLQPSEFMKPCFAVVIAWICAENLRRVDFPGYALAIGVYVLSALLLVIQPDIGMTITITSVWGLQLFLAGLPLFWVFLIGIAAIVGLFSAYHFLPHVAKRIDAFLNPEAGENYQVARSLEAFQNGGLIGRGPGEGLVKQNLPDSHTDFIFAVAGEEFGAIVCLLLIGLFAFIVLRGFVRVWKENDLFVLLSVVGVLSQFGVQSIINMGVAVNLLPAKGMTLPFISYGGSSVLGVALGLGIMLALTRKRYGKS